jgi:hypothetical protein
LTPGFKKKITKVISFHHPRFGAGRFTWHAYRAASAVVDLDHRIPFLDPIGCSKFIDRTNLADSKTTLTDLRL